MQEGCGQSHHHVTDTGIKALHRFLGTLLDGVQFFHQGVMTPKLLLRWAMRSRRFMWGSMGHDVQCHIPLNGLIGDWHD